MNNKRQTRLIIFLANKSRNLFNVFQKKYLFFQYNFSSALFFLFIGFLCGNLFGTFLIWIRYLIPWDGFIICIFLIAIEIISYQRYHTQGRFFLFFWSLLSSSGSFFYSTEQKPVVNTLSILINLFKLGLLLGFFIDAFKVGS